MQLYLLLPLHLSLLIPTSENHIENFQNEWDTKFVQLDTIFTLKSKTLGAVCHV